MKLIFQIIFSCTFVVILSLQNPLFAANTIYSNSSRQENTYKMLAQQNIQNFEPAQYDGDVQVWDICSNSRGTTYYACGFTFTTYNGSNWASYKTNNSNYFRALLSDNSSNRAWAAGDNTFGYWQLDELGEWDYNEIYHTDDVIWRIERDKELIYFQSHENLYIYDIVKNEVSTIFSNPNIHYIHSTPQGIYIQVDKLFYKIDNRQLTLMDFELDDRAISINEIDDTLYIFSEYNGVYTYDSSKTIKQLASLTTNSLLSRNRIFTVELTPENNIIIGTVINGIYIINAKGELLHHISTKAGLGHTTVLSTHLTPTHLYIGLDGGISFVELNPNQFYYNSYPEDIGSVYCHTTLDDKILLGTNKGLYIVDHKDNNSTLRLIIKRQVWDIANVNGRVIASCDGGVYEVLRNSQTIKLCDEGWFLHRIPDNPNLIVSNNNDGIMVFESNDSGIHLRNRLEGYNEVNRSIILDSRNNIWVIGYQGKVLRLSVDKDFRTVKSQKFYNIPNSDSIVWTPASVIDNEILFYNKRGCYRYDSTQDIITESEYYKGLFDVINCEVTSLTQHENRFFYINDKEIGVAERSGETFINREKIFIPIQGEMIPLSFRRITITDSYAITGYNNGYAYYEIETQNKDRYAMELEGVSYTLLGVEHKIVFNEAIEIDPRASNIVISLSQLSSNDPIEVFINNKEHKTRYESGKIIIPYLESGEYVIEIRRGNDNDSIRVEFEILPTFTETPYFYSLLFIIVLILMLSITVFNKHRDKKIKSKIATKQKEELERERMKYENQTLAMKIKERDRRLTNFTMTSIRFNNILANVEEQVAELKTDDLVLKSKIKEILRSIKMHRKGEENWKMFEKYFNRFYDGFFERLKERHPALTPNDLKIAAYVKLMLSTKEIASLMNISTGSVDTARHRLRRNLGLTTGNSLTSYLDNL